MMLILSLFALLLADASPPVRIGYGESRPYCYTRGGQPRGFLIDLFNEAARREQIQLEWTLSGPPEANTRALADGTLHLLPLAVALPERRRFLFVTEPWWWEETILLVRADAPAAKPSEPASIALPEILTARARLNYPRARQLKVFSAPAALEKVCIRQADAALVGSTFIRDLVNERPAVCESVRLRILDSSVTVAYSIISAAQFRRVAERLRGRINEMTADGTLAEIAARHPPISAPHVAHMTEEVRARYNNQRLTTWLLSVSAFLAVGVFAFIRKILSHRKLRAILEQQLRTEQELRDSQAALRQRTMDLVRSNEDLQAFAYSVSHDLQEPVRNQALYSELLERRYKDVLPAEAREFLRVIRTSALRTNHMMQSLLTYSRVGHDDRRRSLVDCTVVVNHVIDDLRVLLSEAEARVVAHPLPAVWGWEDRLQQVFQNLIENATKYRRPDTTPVIIVSALRSGAEWRFAVSDNGIGFNQDYAGKVFGLFKRLHGPDRYGGSGIGLALCKRVIERHGGRIWAESREGEGSTFYFTLPVNPTDGSGSPSGYLEAVAG
jgi:signal transduction histidine kinase